LVPLLLFEEMLRRRWLRVKRVRADGSIRVWLARRDVRGLGRPGNGIPDGVCRNGPLKDDGAAVINPVAADPAHERANHPTANQQAPFRRYKVNINVGPRKQPHFTLGQQSCIGHIDDFELATGTQTHLRQRLVARRRPPATATSIALALIQQ
jgi:hypothetical protein